MNKICVWILGDQLLQQHPALRAAEQLVSKNNITVLFIESAARSRQLPYQRKKLVLLFSAMRHYAQSLHQEGYDVEYVQAATFLTGLTKFVVAKEPAQIMTMAAASYPGRQMQLSLDKRLGVPVTVLPNTQFVLGRYNPIPEPEADKLYVMEGFYRSMRRHFDILMDGSEPAGQQWNFDKANRKKLPKDRHPPPLLPFAPNEVTKQVMDEIADFEIGVGTVDNFAYAVTREQALMAFQDFLENRLAYFGDYEDAMTHRSHVLYHSLLSPYLNLGLLEPMELVREAERAYRQGQAPINAVEGFVRQIVGWREFMYWQYWRQMPGMVQQNAWVAKRPLPAFVWDGQTDMACLRHALSRALDSGYNHHIERLMLLCNFFLLAGINPKAVNDWFLALYIDAYDWVMPPNVIGMGLNADGGLTATKPYIASANYINKMSDFCPNCRYNAKERQTADACPFNYLYWNFILKHEERLRANPRTSRNVWGLRHLSDADRASVQVLAAEFLDGL